MADTGIERGAAALDKQIEAKRKPRKKHLHGVSGGGDAGGLPAIRHDAGRLPEVLDELGAALSAHGGLYVYADRLVRIYTLEAAEEGSIRRPQGAVVIHPVETAHLMEIAGRAARHERFDARAGDYRRCDCPRRVAEAYGARGHWPELPRLAGIIEAPTVLDGRVLDAPGYSPASGLFLAHGRAPGYAPPPERPTFDDAERALTVLLDLFRDFPLVGYEDRAGMLAGIITGLVRRVLPSAPMIAITAPTPGTGKTLLAETISVIATGRRPSVLSLGHDDSESEKRLAGVLLAGDACIALDNIERPLRGDLLCQVLTQPSVRLRPLGVSGMISVPTHAMLIATGNNLSIIGDLRRRVALVRLDAGVERPEQRGFARDHLAEVLAHRGELIHAALTIVTAYLAAGAPAIPDLPSYGGFAEWDRLVRRPLVWLGLLDPLKASETLRDEDPDLLAMRALLAAWCDAFGDRAVTAAEVVDAGMATAVVGAERTNPSLYESLQLVCAEKPNARRLGHWLRRHRNRIADGMQVQAAQGDSHAKVGRWRVVSAGNAGNAGFVST